MKKYFILIIAFVLSLTFSQNAFATSLFGFDFLDNAFSDDARLISGQLDYYGFSKRGYPITGDDQIDIRNALNGPDLFTMIEGKRFGEDSKSAYVVDVLFNDNVIFNGPGFDLAVWERGQAEDIAVSIFDPQINDWRESFNFPTTNVGNLLGSVDVSPGVNVASINLDLWSLPKEVQISKIRLIENDIGNAGNADIAAIGALNSQNPVPEPATILLFSSGLFGVFVRRKLNK